MSPEPYAFDPARIFAALNAEGVEYVVIGGVAAALHGSSVRTGDSDVCPARTSENLQRLATALRHLGAAIRTGRDTVPLPATAELLGAAEMWNLVTADYGDLDVAFVPAGTSGYDDLIQHAVVYDIGDGVVVTVASLDDVIRSKEAAGRAKDREHLVFLRALRDRVGD